MSLCVTEFTAPVCISCTTVKGEPSTSPPLTFLAADEDELVAAPGPGGLNVPGLLLVVLGVSHHPAQHPHLGLELLSLCVLPCNVQVMECRVQQLRPLLLLSIYSYYNCIFSSFAIYLTTFFLFLQQIDLNFKEN